MRRFCAGLLAITAVLAVAGPAIAYTQSDLKAKIAREMRLGGPASGAYVRDMGSGEELFALRADRARMPASLEKLYTTSTALLRLGPTATLQTSAMAAGDAVVDESGVLRGDLVLVGGGDPFFGDESATALARAVRAAGITRVDGAVLGDESAFDARRASCCRGYDFEIGGVLSALAYDGGIFRGRARLDAARFAAGRFAGRLRAIGVPVSGKSHSGTTPAGARAIAATPSRTIADLARFINVPSDNFAAEMLLKGLGAGFGAGGTTSAGAAVIRATVAEFGAGPLITDGSGLSRANRSSPRDVVRLLERMHQADVAEPFRTSLAVAGESGTVLRRMRGTPAARRCQVKTGTLRDVSALAGYCLARGGRDIGFALLFNRVHPGGAKAIEDRIAAAIARVSSAPAPVPDAGPDNSGGVTPNTTPHDSKRARIIWSVGGVETPTP